MPTNRWTKDQLKLAFFLYCQLPFGKLHRGHPEIIDLATVIGRTPSAVAMKLVNFASLDPAITSTGRKGLGNASSEDQIVWDEFNSDWERLAVEVPRLRKKLGESAAVPRADEIIEPADYAGETKAITVEVRLKQSFFRRAVLSSYGRCCMSGIREPRLLTASHIVPWSVDKANRLNPRNGLCLSALHDRAFDVGLITVSEDMRVEVAPKLFAQTDSAILRSAVLELNGRKITLPERFVPEASFLEWHRKYRFNTPSASPPGHT